jgi:hypothetical protein
MEMNDLPVGAASRHDERDSTRIAKRLAVPHTGCGVESGDYDGPIGQNHCRGVTQARSARTIVEERVLEVAADLLVLCRDCLAARAENKASGE